MSILTPIIRLALLGGAAALAAPYVIGALPINETPVSVEAGYANPEHVELHKPVNENGNLEFFLKYDDGTETTILPIMTGPNGPLVGDIDYYWQSIGDEVKSRLVEESWNDLDLGMRKGVIRNELENMIENYGGELR